MSSPWLQWLTDTSRHLLAGARDLVYPACCLLCEQPSQPESPHFCANCRQALFRDPQPCCPRCAGTIGPFALIDGRCQACRDEPFAFAQAVRLGPYDGLLRDAILRLKYRTAEGLAELLGECWAEIAVTRFEELHVDTIVPVPLHWLRRWQRGYNQSEALARGLAMRLHVPSQPSWLRRVRHTPPQTSQTAAGRKANVRGAFRARSRAPLQGRAVLLVDDVMTTGATAGEAARVLRAGGASRVVVAVLARAQG